MVVDLSRCATPGPCLMWQRPVVATEVEVRLEQFSTAPDVAASMTTGQLSAVVTVVSLVQKKAVPDSAAGSAECRTLTVMSIDDGELAVLLSQASTRYSAIWNAC